MEAFIQRMTAVGRSVLAPEVSLHLATDVTALWQATEDFLQAHNIAPPFWAFAWPGSEALARHVLDHPELVTGKRVLDFAAGGGLAAIACAKAGAAAVEAADIDVLARAAVRLNAELNGVQVAVAADDVVSGPCRWDVILCGDIFYEAPMTRHVLPWLRRCAEAAVVLAADPGRAYAPAEGREEVARLTVPTSRALEDHDTRDTVIYRLQPCCTAVDPHLTGD